MAKRVNSEGVRIGSNAGKLYWVDSLGFEYGFFKKKNYEVVSIKAYFNIFLLKLFNDSLLYSHTVFFLNNIYVYLVATNVDAYFKHPRLKKKKSYLKFFNTGGLNVSSTKSRLVGNRVVAAGKSLRLVSIDNSKRQSSGVVSSDNLLLSRKIYSKYRKPLSSFVKHYRNLGVKVDTVDKGFMVKQNMVGVVTKPSEISFRNIENVSIFRSVYFNVSYKYFSNFSYSLKNTALFYKHGGVNVRPYFLYISVLRSLLNGVNLLHNLLELCYYTHSSSVLLKVFDSIRGSFSNMYAINVLKSPNFYFNNYLLDMPKVKIEEYGIMYYSMLKKSANKIECLELLGLLTVNSGKVNKELYSLFTSIFFLKDWIKAKEYMLFTLVRNILSGISLRLSKGGNTRGVSSAFGKKLLYKDIKLYCDSVAGRYSRIEKFLLNKVSEVTQDKVLLSNSVTVSLCDSSILSYIRLYVFNQRKSVIYKLLKRNLPFNCNIASYNLVLYRFYSRLSIIFSVFRLSELLLVSVNMVSCGQLCNLSQNFCNMYKQYIHDVEKKRIIEPLVYEVAPKLDEYVFLYKKTGISLKSDFGLLSKFITNYLSNLKIRIPWFSRKMYKQINLDYNFLLDRQVLKLKKSYIDRLGLFNVFYGRYLTSRYYFLKSIKLFKKSVEVCNISTLNMNLKTLNLGVFSASRDVYSIGTVTNARISTVGNVLYYKLLLFRLRTFLSMWNKHSMYYFLDCFEDLCVMKHYMEQYIERNYGKSLMVNFRVISRFNVTANLLAEYIIVRLRKKDRITHIIQMISKQLRIIEKRDISSLERKSSFYRRYVMDSNAMGTSSYNEYKNLYLTKYFRKGRSTVINRVGSVSWNTVNSVGDRFFARSSYGNFGKNRYFMLKSNHFKNIVELSSRFKYRSNKERLSDLYSKSLLAIRGSSDELRTGVDSALPRDRSMYLLQSKSTSKASTLTLKSEDVTIDNVLEDVKLWYTIGENILGYRIECKGMFMRTGTKRTKLYRISRGKVSISSLNEDVEFVMKKVVLKAGTCSVKVWLYKKNEFTFLEPEKG